MDKDKEFEAYHRGYDQGRFDEYADQMGYNKAKLIKNRIEKQKNCPYCHSGHQWIYKKDNSARLVTVKLKGNKSHPYRLWFSYRDKLEKDDYEAGGWEIRNTTEHYGVYINYCPMCGRTLGGNEDDD